MSKSEYEWDTINNPPTIKAHSLNKHVVTMAYLNRYLEKLYQVARGYIRLSIVDGFAGGGIYKTELDGKLEFGSPIKLMRTINEAKTTLADKYQKKVDIRARYYFVEKHPGAISTLKAVLTDEKLLPFEDPLSRIIQGDVLEHWNPIIESIRSEGKTHRALFILDQYGYKDVPMMYIQNLFKELPHAEVILTFAVDWLIDYLSDKPRQIDTWTRRFNQLGIDCDVRDVVNIKKSSPAGRFIIQDMLSEELSKKCGAKYFTRYFIRTTGKLHNDSHRDIWLVHLSQHDIARDEMVKVHWGEANHISAHSGFQGLDDHGLIRLGYSTRLDENLLGQINLEFTFDRERDLKSSKSILLNQIPDIVWRLSENGPFTFALLMSEIANYSPASSDLIRDVIHYLLETKDISVVCPETNKRRQKGATIKFSDIIKVAHKGIFLDGLNIK